MIPALSTRELFDRYVIPTYARFDLRLARGEGARVWDEAGQRYLDFGAGIAVTSVGPLPSARRRERCSEQLGDARPHLQIFTTPRRRACSPSGWCGSSGAARQGLLLQQRRGGQRGALQARAEIWQRRRAARAARTPWAKWSQPAAHRHDIITMLDSFHGRTLAGIAATGQEKVKKGFEPLVRGLPPCAVQRRRRAARGRAGARRRPRCCSSRSRARSASIPPTPEFLRLARDLCDRHGAAAHVR